MIKNLITIIFICCSHLVFAQIAFTNASDKLANKFVNSGAALGVADMNGDGLDDIIRLHSTTQLIIDEQSTSGNFVANITGINSPQSVWSMCIGDVDRNGKNDVFLATANHFHRMAWADDNNKSYTEELLNGPVILPQASNMADINNDGNLDLFVCNDNGNNLPYLGDGKALHHDPTLINTSTNPVSDNSGNYGSVWIDYDNDQDQDLFISKCRLGINDPNDPRRVNQLFENDGNGNFNEVALSKGLVPFAQSWSTDFGDIDNDGDLDAFMINHDQSSRLYENDGAGNFTDITNGAGFSPSIENHGLGIQVKMADFDNDTYLDILITSSQGGFRCFRNNGNKKFTPIFSAFQTLDPMQSFAIGDLNNDGFLDVIGGFGQYFNTPTTIFDKLFLNNGTDNNWIRINLRGTNSNINGIGARIELYGAWGVMLREIRSGESYGISNSLSANYGLGGSSEIDSMFIKWPSGFVQKINNPSINQVHLIEEGGCVNPPETIINETLCEGEVMMFEDQTYTQSGVYNYGYPLLDGCDSIIVLDLQFLPSSENYMSLSICDGDIINLPDGSSQVITQNAIFNANFTSESGCDSMVILDLTVLPVYTGNESFTVCQGENYTWPDGTSSVILDSQSYTSHLVSQYNCDSTIVTSLNVIPAPNSQEYIDVCRGESISFPDGNTIVVSEDIVYTIAYPLSANCDSVANFIISLSPEYNIVDSAIGCRGGLYTFPDGTVFDDLSQDFSYTSYLYTANGCDSIILVNLSLEDGSQETQFAEVCQGDIYLFPDGSEQAITVGYTHTSILLNEYGCDSIVYTSINTKQRYQFTLAQMICSGDNYTFFDGSTQLDITEDITYDSYFTTFDGCDSIITTDLTVVPPVFSYETGLVCAGETYIFPDGSVIPNILTELIYESTFIASNGCDSIVNTTVEVSPAYNEIINLGVCPGEAILLNGLTLENLQSDTLIVFIESTSFGCDSITTYQINVDNIDSSVTLNQATVTALAVDVSYQWLDCNDNANPIPDATFQIFTPDEDGDYQVMLEGPTGCISISECINITGVATEDPLLSSKISLFPNPAQHQIQVVIQDETTITTGAIYDICGRVMLRFNVESELTELGINHLASGLYLIKIDTEQSYGISRFVKL